MGLPDSAGTHYGEVPGDNEAIGITRQETLVGSHKDGGMHLGLVAAQNRLGLRRSPVGGHFVQSPMTGYRMAEPVMVVIVVVPPGVVWSLKLGVDVQG